MLAATIIFSGRQWLWPSLVVLVVAAAFVFWNYRHSTLPAGARFLCAVLKLTGLLALLLCVLEPLGSGQRARPGANYLALVADNSQGMQVKDRGQTKGRGEVLKAGLADAQAGWRARLEEAFQVRSYLFDSRLQSTKDFSELQFDGRASAIGASLRSLADRYRGQPLAGVLLFTDGNATDLTAASLNFEGLPPVYPVVIGADDSIPDLAIQKVSVTQTAFEDSPVTVQADVEAIGYSGEAIVAQLLDPATVVTNAAGTREGKVVAQQSLRAGRDGEPVIFRLQYRPEKTGVAFYQLRVSAKDELEQFTKPTASREATLANNSRTVVVDRGGGPFRVLYVSGRPNWEFKFLNRALDEEKDLVQLVGLIRIAKREPKFEFRGRAGESSNPLFRGFDGKSKEEIERYDQPVLIRFNTRDQLELSGGFPKTAEDLFAYHAIILDDLEAEFFTHEQMVLLQKFVSERGGGFLMLGGQESFANGKYERTPIADLLPVYLDRAPVGRPLGEAKLNLTREGWLQPWARLRNNEADERTRLEEMPSFLVVNQVREVKPGASVVATVIDAKGTLVPAVATQRYGSGRAVAMMIGDFWHWGFRDEATHRDMDKAWRQLIRHVLADVPERVTIEARPKADDPNQAVELFVRVRDQKFQPLDNASVSFRIQAFPNEPVVPGTNSPGAVATNLARFTAEAATSEPGLYVGSHIPRLTGGYKAVAVVTNAAGAEVGRAEAGWTADPAAEEFRSLKPNRALMELLARKTGGEIVPFAKLDQFVRELPNRKAPVADTWTYPLWHRAPVLLFALICFVAEWALRRTKGLA